MTKLKKTPNLKTEEKNCEKLTTYIMTKPKNLKYNQIKKIVTKLKKNYSFYKFNFYKLKKSVSARILIFFILF